MCSHLECPFYCIASDTCDYFVVTGNRRPTPSDVCEKYKTDFTGEDRPLSFRAVPGGINKDALLRMQKYYTPGMGAKALARLAHASDHYTQRWIRRAHPEDERSFRNAAW